MRLPILIITVSMAGAASAQTCTPRAFAQYQAELKQPPTGRVRVAFAYCKAKTTRDRAYQLGNQIVATACDSEMTKAKDALRADGDAAAVDFAMRGCVAPLEPK